MHISSGTYMRVMFRHGIISSFFTDYISQYRFPGICHTQTLPDLQKVYRDSSLQILFFHDCRRAVAFIGEIFGLRAAVRPSNPIPFFFLRTVLVLTVLPETVLNSCVTVLIDERRLLITMILNDRRAQSVNIMGSIWS